VAPHATATAAANAFSSADGRGARSRPIADVDADRRTTAPREGGGGERSRARAASNPRVADALPDALNTARARIGPLVETIRLAARVGRARASAARVDADVVAAVVVVARMSLARVAASTSRASLCRRVVSARLDGIVRARPPRRARGRQTKANVRDVGDVHVRALGGVERRVDAARRARENARGANL
jgi:hypothetical protein